MSDKKQLTSAQQQTLQRLVYVQQFLISNLQAVQTQLAQFSAYLKKEHKVDDTWQISEDFATLEKLPSRPTPQPDKKPDNPKKIIDFPHKE